MHFNPSQVRSTRTVAPVRGPTLSGSIKRTSPPWPTAACSVARGTARTAKAAAMSPSTDSVRYQAGSLRWEKSRRMELNCQLQTHLLGAPLLVAAPAAWSLCSACSDRARSKVRRKAFQKTPDIHYPPLPRLTIGDRSGLISFSAPPPPLNQEISAVSTALSFDSPLC